MLYVNFVAKLKQLRIIFEVHRKSYSMCQHKRFVVVKFYYLAYLII